MRSTRTFCTGENCGSIEASVSPTVGYGFGNAEPGVSWVTTRRLRDFETVHGHVGRVCFKNGPPDRVGAELEWPVAPLGNHEHPVPADDIKQLLHHAVPLPGGSRLIIEPGGQVELSSPVAPDLTQRCHLLGRDLDRRQELPTSLDLAIVPAAPDPGRPPSRRTPLDAAARDDSATRRQKEASR